jgi:hypothetical protein
MVEDPSSTCTFRMTRRETIYGVANTMVEQGPKMAHWLHGMFD